jgi:GGDEF domain-containing protein
VADLNPERMRLFLAISAPLLRASVRQALYREPGVEIVGEAPSAAAVEAIDADFILCDERTLSDPGMERFAQAQPRSSKLRFVLMTSNPRLVNYRGAIPVTLSLRLDAAGSEIRGRLAESLRTPPPPLLPEPQVELEERFFVVGRGAPIVAPAQDLPPPVPPSRLVTEQPALVDMQGMPLEGTRKISTRRQQPDAYDVIVNRLAVVAEQLQKQRDTITGLATSIALDSALQALRDTEGPAAVIVLQLRYITASGAQRLTLDQAALQSAGAALRASIRSEDLACWLDGTNFATVMPGLGEPHSATTVRRIRNALTRVSGSGPGDAILAAAVGVGYRSPEVPVAEMLEQAWKGMLAYLKLLAGERLDRS